eukprot:15305483-Heterocapsa_arctica.AAC.1
MRVYAEVYAGSTRGLRVRNISTFVNAGLRGSLCGVYAEVFTGSTRMKRSIVSYVRFYAAVYAGSTR